MSIGKYSGKGIVPWLWATFADKYTCIAVHTRDGRHLSDNGDHHRIWHGKEENISKGVLFCDLTMTTSFDTVLRACRNGDQKAQNVSILTKAWQWHGLGRQHNGIIHLSIQQKTSQITSHAATCPWTVRHTSSQQCQKSIWSLSIQFKLCQKNNIIYYGITEVTYLRTYRAYVIPSANHDKVSGSCVPLRLISVPFTGLAWPGEESVAAADEVEF